MEKIMSKPRYLLATPVKNEEENLPNLIHSVAEQTIKPVLWIIVDDGSMDDSPKIIEDATNRYVWVKSVRLKESPRDLTIHVSYVYKSGIDFAIEYCKEHSIQYDYICFLDADMIIRDKDFFKKIFSKFEKNYRLGIASGSIQVIDNGWMKNEWRREDTISGGETICRRKCFEDAGGIPSSYSWESVLSAKAKLRGWGVKRFEEIRAIQTRKTSSAEGLWKGYKINGLSCYYLNYNPIIVVAKALKLCLFEKPYYIGIAFLLGYFDGLLHRKEQINDEEVKYYFRHVKPQELKKWYIQKILQMMRYENQNKH
jgi:glycosyltransferase involved in cell wall biosynthesis